MSDIGFQIGLRTLGSQEHLKRNELQIVEADIKTAKDRLAKLDQKRKTLIDEIAGIDTASQRLLEAATAAGRL